MKQPGYALRRGNPSVEEESWIHLATFGVFGSRKTLFERRSLRRRQTSVGLGAGAHQGLWIEATRSGVEHHSVFQAVASVARVEKSVDDCFLVRSEERRVGKEC